MDPVPPQPPTPTPTIPILTGVPTAKPKSKSWLWVITGITLFVVGALVGVYLKPETKLQPAPSPVVATSPTPFVSQPEIQWRQTPLMGYSFEYPNGWHVASQWTNTSAQGIYVWIDPEPISGAPRGGPAATIEITDINGVPNSEEIFNQKLETYRNDYENVKEETVDSNLGKIYHFTGTLPEGYLGGATLEAYLLRIVRPNDAINDRVITLSTINQQKYSAVLRHIALSIKTPD